MMQDFSGNKGNRPGLISFSHIAPFNEMRILCSSWLILLPAFVGATKTTSRNVGLPASVSLAACMVLHGH
jgi:hypothetical protein